MKACDIMNDLIGTTFLQQHPDTVDTRKAGDPQKEVRKIGVCLVATPQVLQAAKDWGADLLITHEPTFYNHPDERDASPLTARKEALVRESGLTLYRYHDSLHAKPEDLIDRALLDAVGWVGEPDGNRGFLLKESRSPKSLARDLAAGLQLRHPRIVGAGEGQVRRIRLALGAWGSAPFTAFRTDDYEVILCGELCEWYDCEPIRDLAQMGEQKTILILGHAGSERAGMRLLANRIDGKYDGAAAAYFECGELYDYAE